jgi:hypothetical protein
MFTYGHYDINVHETLQMSPKEVFEQGMSKSGDRDFKLIPYTRDFEISTLPSTRKGVATVRPSKGVRINNLQYNSREIQALGVDKVVAPVRIDPDNAGVAYVYLNKRWTTCYSEFYSVFNGRSLKEVQLASEEIRGRRHATEKAKKVRGVQLARFLSEVKHFERLLAQQRRDRENAYMNAQYLPKQTEPEEPGVLTEKAGTRKDSEVPSLEDY